MNFSDIKEGDTIRVTTPAHTASRGFTAKMVEVAERTVTVRVNTIRPMASRPGHFSASATVLVDVDGTEYTQRNPAGFVDGPSFEFADSHPRYVQSFERV